MSQPTECRLCLNTCNASKRLYHTNGRATEWYEMTFEILHPKIVDLEAAQYLNVICLACASHLEDFQLFQKSIKKAQLNLFKDDRKGVAVKTETVEGTSEDLEYMEAVFGDPAQSATEDISIEKEENPLKDTPLSVEEMSESEDEDHISQRSERGTANMTMDFITLPKLEIVDVVPSDGHSDNSSDDEEEKDSEADITTPGSVVPTSDLKYDCTICGNYFKRKCDLTVHMRRNHPQSPTATGDKRQRSTCEICASTLSDYRSLRRHLMILHGIRKDASLAESHQCTICSNSFKRKSNFVAHMRWQHGPSSQDVCKKPRVHCEFCTNSFSSRSNLVAHLKCQHGLDKDPQSAAFDGDIDFDETAKKFSCKMCGIFFTHKIRLIRHIEKSHPDLLKQRTKHDAVAPKMATSCDVFKCKFCDYASVRKRVVIEHMEQQHGIGPHNFEFENDETTTMFQCILCPASFTNKSAARKHMESHWQEDVITKKLEFEYNDSSKLLQCKLCSTSGINVHSLVAHMAQQHWKTEITKTVCQICKKEFVTKVELAKHYTLVHCPPGEYPCTNCGSTFKKRRLLNTHRNTAHTIITKCHKCKICEKAFRTSTELKTHMISHTQAKKYSCSICPSKFKQATSVRRHMRTSHPQENSRRDDDQADDDDCVMEEDSGDDDESQITVPGDELESE